jgi:hypothetical protein
VFLWVCCVLNMLTMTTKQEHNTQTPLSMLQVEREEAYTRFVSGQLVHLWVAGRGLDAGTCAKPGHYSNGLMRMCSGVWLRLKSLSDSQVTVPGQRAEVTIRIEFSEVQSNQWESLISAAVCRHLPHTSTKCAPCM